MLSSTIALFCLVTMGSAMAERAAILIKAPDDIDLEALKGLKFTSAVYKVKLIYTKGVERLFNGVVYVPLPKYIEHMTHQWNYLVMGKDFRTTEERKEFEDQVSKFAKSVKNGKASFSIGLTANPGVNAESLNQIITGSKGKEHPPVVRPLKKYQVNVQPLKKAKNVRHYCSGNTCTCDDITLNSVASSQKIFQIDLSRVDNKEEVQKIMVNLLMRIFPALEIRYQYSGRPIEDVFNGFNIVEFPSKTVFCEYGLSQLVENFAKGDSFESLMGLVAVQV